MASARSLVVMINTLVKGLVMKTAVMDGDDVRPFQFGSDDLSCLATIMRYVLSMNGLPGLLARVPAHAGSMRLPLFLLKSRPLTNTAGNFMSRTAVSKATWKFANGCTKLHFCPDK